MVQVGMSAVSDIDFLLKNLGILVAFNIGKPRDVIIARYYTGNLKNGVYALLNDGEPGLDGDGLQIAYTVKATITPAGAPDIAPLLHIVGQDINGTEVSEDLQMVSTNYSVKAYKKILSITASGWEQVEGNDTIEIGCGDFVGLHTLISSVTQVKVGFYPTLISSLSGSVIVGATLAECLFHIVPFTPDGDKQLVLFITY